MLEGKMRTPVHGTFLGRLLCRALKECMPAGINQWLFPDGPEMDLTNAPMSYCWQFWL